MCLFLAFSFLFVCLLALIICKSQFNSRIRIESMKIFLWFPNCFHLTWWRKPFKCFRGGMNFFGQGVWMRWSKQIPFLGSPPVKPHPQLKWAWRSTHLQWLPVQLCRQGVATRHRTHSFPCMELFRSCCQYGDMWERSGFCARSCRWNPLRILGGNSGSFRMAGAESVTQCHTDLTHREISPFTRSGANSIVSIPSL